MIFGFISKRLDLPALAGLLFLLFFCLPFLLDLRWVAALATLVVRHIRTCSKILLPLSAFGIVLLAPILPPFPRVGTAAPTALLMSLCWPLLLLGLHPCLLLWWLEGNDCWWNLSLECWNIWGEVGRLNLLMWHVSRRGLCGVAAHLNHGYTAFRFTYL